MFAALSIWLLTVPDLLPLQEFTTMNKPGYYSSGQFARMANVTVRTIRFYDSHNILKPSYVNEKGARFYTDSDFARLQQILLLKYLGFSLDEIRELTIDDGGSSYLLNSLYLQQKLVEDRMEQMQQVYKAIGETTQALEENGSVDWKRMLDLIHLTSMEDSLATQYRNASNLSARIRLHTLYSENKQGWFPWIFSQLPYTSGMKILELGCGSGSLWKENLASVPADVDILLSDISEGMIRDIRRSLSNEMPQASFRAFDCCAVPFPENSFDLVIANHLLFYCERPETAIREAARVLREDGTYICSTYSKAHMQEITMLVQEFDPRIVLSADRLYEKFGLENGEHLLAESFSHIEKRIYPDRLVVDRPEPLIEYILSCHGNQNRYLLDRYQEFRQFVAQKTANGFTITKEAGLFICH